MSKVEEKPTFVGLILKFFNERVGHPLWNLYLTSFIVFHFKVIMVLFSDKDLSEKIDLMSYYSTDRLYEFLPDDLEVGYFFEILFILFVPLIIGFLFYFLMARLELLTMELFLDIRQKLKNIKKDFTLVSQIDELKKEIKEKENKLAEKEKELSVMVSQNDKLANQIDAFKSHYEKMLDKGEDYRSTDLDRILKLGVDTYQAEHLMVAFPCSTTIDLNNKYKLYYHPASRSIREGTEYIGIYANKEIKYIGKIKDIVVSCPEKNGDWNFYLESDNNRLLQEEDMVERIKSAVNESPPEYHLESYNVKHYLFDEIYEVNIKKDSKGPLLGRKYFDLVNDFGIEISDDLSFEEICKAIKGAKYE